MYTDRNQMNLDLISSLERPIHNYLQYTPKKSSRLAVQVSYSRAHPQDVILMFDKIVRRT